MASYTYKLRMQPNADQASRLFQHFGICRYVYNHFLEQRNTTYKNTGKGSSYQNDCSALTKLKKEFTWISDANSQSLQQELKNLDTSFNRFFKKQAKFPKFHSKHKDKQSFRIPQHVSVENRKIIFPKFREGISIKLHRSIEGEIKFATISKNRAGQYFACITVEREMPKLKTKDNAVGVDLGIKSLATCSNGEVFPNLNPFRKMQKRLRRLQQSVNRKVKDSHNWVKAKGLVAKLHQKIADIRSNHLHRVSKLLVNENQVIVLEDLNVKGMMANRKLAKSIADVSFSELIRQIEYKAEWYGREVVKIDRWYPSSKTCHCCGCINESLTLKDRDWTCPRCRMKHDRDYNASMNILQEGLRQQNRTVGTTGIVCGEGVRLPQGSDFR